MTKELTIEREEGFESIDFEANDDGSLSIYEHYDRGCNGVAIQKEELPRFMKFMAENFDWQGYEHWLREGK